jgi:hypothetical protein
MSLAIYVQREDNTIPGGSIDGIRATTASTANANQFYGRRLTDMLVNEAFSVGNNTVKSYVVSSGSTTSTSTPGTFTLAAGTYRISVDATYNLASAADSVIMGLYSVTGSAFALYSTDSSPILGTTIFGNNGINVTSRIVEAALTVGSDTTYQINHACSATGSGRALSFCGKNTSMTAANVNNAAAKNIYCQVKILRLS